jgi:hypothetical protein
MHMILAYGTICIMHGTINVVFSVSLYSLICTISMLNDVSNLIDVFFNLTCYITALPQYWFIVPLMKSHISQTLVPV